MTFSQQRVSVLRPQKSLALGTFLIALLMAAALFLPYMMLDDGYFLFYGDFNVQQIPFYQHCHEMIRSGNIGWDFGTDLGVNFFGSYTFYLLGSPFFWVTLLFPNSFVPYLMGPLLIFKFALAALTSYLYISRFTKNNETARLGAILYAFSGFSVYNVFFNHFHEAIIIFPLLLLSVELLITENRRGIFALCVCLAAVSNYFFFFGMVVFTVIYWFVRLLSGAIKITAGRFLALLFEAVIGLFMSAVILVPTLAALAENSRLSETLMGWGAVMYGKEQIYANIIQCFFFPPDLPARPVFFPGADVKWSSLGGWLPLFSMVGVFAWMQGKRGHWLRRVIGIMIFMALVPILNSAFYMFNAAYYARWFYMPVLMMCLATCMALEDREVNLQSAWRWTFFITLGISAVIGFMPAGRDDNGKITHLGIYTEDGDAVYRDRFFIYVAIAVISLIIVRILLSQKKKNPEFFMRGALACVCVMSVLYSSVFVGLGKTHSYNVDTVMIPALIENTVDLGEDDNFRTDCYECVDNTGMYLGYDCINAFHSVVPTSVTEFYEFIGEERGVASRPTDKSYAARSLLSVKYLFDLKDGSNFDNDGETVMPGYTYFSTQSGYDIYENRNYIPYGFTYDYYMTEADAVYFGNEYASNMMLKALLLNDDQIYKYRSVLKPITDDYYLEYEGDERQEISFTDESFAADCEARAATAAYSFKKDGSSFTAEIRLPRENLVFFSIPYDEGWMAYVNGEKVEIEKVNVGFMAVKASEGLCEIRFEYKTPCLSLGVMVTAVATVLWLLYTVLSVLYYKRNPASDNYPEGEALLEQWRAYETADAVSETESEIQEVDEGETDLLDEISPTQGNFENRFVGGFKIREELFSQENVDSEQEKD